MALLNHDQIKNKNKKTLTRGPKIEINNQVSRVDIDKDNFTKDEIFIVKQNSLRSRRFAIV